MTLTFQPGNGMTRYTWHW